MANLQVTTITCASESGSASRWCQPPFDVHISFLASLKVETALLSCLAPAVVPLATTRFARTVVDTAAPVIFAAAAVEISLFPGPTRTFGRLIDLLN